MSVWYFSVWTLSKIVKVCKRRAAVIMLILAVALLAIKWKIICLNIHPRLHILRVCASFENGQSMGNLCQSLCHSQGASPISCHTFNSQKAAVFTSLWMNTTAVFKAIKPVPDKEFTALTSTFDIKENNNYSIETDFVMMIKTVVKTKFNLDMSYADAKRMSYIQYSQEGGNRYTEMQNVWSLLQDNEYLIVYLYEKYDVFPKLLGACGTLYAVEKLESISGYWHLMTLYDSQQEWEKRIKISIMILDLLKHLEEDLPEPLLLCDVKMDHFGVTSDFKKVKYLDLDAVHPVSLANKLAADGMPCEEHSDCDISDCRSLCNFETSRCQFGVANNNLQMICERIFLGWVMSTRVMVPGLLFSPKAPPVLIEVLEQCANPANENEAPRTAATKEIRDRLHNLLTHLVL